MTRQRRPQLAVGFRPTAAVTRAKEQITAASRPQHRWYSMTASADTATIYLHDEIGWGVTASSFIQELAALGTVARVDLHVNSPGGDVWDALAIFNALKRFPAKITSYVDGIAASAASFIVQAADRVVMAPNSMMMIHDAHAVAAGNASDMKALADLLDKTSNSMAAIYAGAAGGTVEDWRTAMRAETWYTAEEAVAAGLADQVLSADVPRNSAPLRQFAARLEFDRLTAGLMASSPGKNVNDLLKNLTEGS